MYNSLTSINTWRHVRKSTGMEVESDWDRWRLRRTWHPWAGAACRPHPYKSQIGEHEHIFLVIVVRQQLLIQYWACMLCTLFLDGCAHAIRVLVLRLCDCKLAWAVTSFSYSNNVNFVSTPLHSKLHFSSPAKHRESIVEGLADRSHTCTSLRFVQGWYQWSTDPFNTLGTLNPEP